MFGFMRSIPFDRVEFIGVGRGVGLEGNFRGGEAGGSWRVEIFVARKKK
jgi:hypothetical protein